MTVWSARAGCPRVCRCSKGVRTCSWRVALKSLISCLERGRPRPLRVPRASTEQRTSRPFPRGLGGAESGVAVRLRLNAEEVLEAACWGSRSSNSAFERTRLTILTGGSVLERPSEKEQHRTISAPWTSCHRARLSSSSHNSKNKVSPRSRLISEQLGPPWQLGSVGEKS